VDERATAGRERIGWGGEWCRMGLKGAGVRTMADDASSEGAKLRRTMRTAASPP